MGGIKKIEKDRKKGLTNDRGFGILSKLSLSSPLRGPAGKTRLKNLEKTVDKQQTMW